MVGGSKSVRGRKNLKKAMNQAPRNPVTETHTSRRLFWLSSLGSGPTVAKPPAAAALDVPTAGVPTYLVASPPPAADVFAASGFSLAESVSGPAMRCLLECWSSKISGGSQERRPFPLYVMAPSTANWQRPKMNWYRMTDCFRNESDLPVMMEGDGTGDARSC